MNTHFALNNKFAARFAVAALLALSTGLTLQANADKAPVATAPDAPTATFSVPDGMTIHKSQMGVAAASATPYTLVKVTGYDAAGLRSISFSGGWSGSTAFYPPGYSTASTQLYFYASYYPAGNYPFKATITNVNGVQTTKTIMVHLLP